MIRTTYEKNRWIIELLGVIAVVASLIFVGLELQQTQQVSFAEQDLTRVQINIGLRDEINEHMDIWLAGNAGEDLDEKSYAIYQNLIQNQWSRQNALSEARRRLGVETMVGIHDFATFLYLNPGARAAWLDYIREEISFRSFLIAGTRSSDLRGNAAIVVADLEKLDNEYSNFDTKPDF